MMTCLWGIAQKRYMAILQRVGKCSWCCLFSLSQHRYAEIQYLEGVRKELAVEVKLHVPQKSGIPAAGFLFTSHRYGCPTLWRSGVGEPDGSSLKNRPFS